MATSAHTPRGPHTLIGALVVALAVAGCGSSASTQSQSAAQPGATQAAATSSTAGSSSGGKSASSSSSSNNTNSTTSSAPGKGEPVPNIDMQVKSSTRLEPIAARYTCDGANSPLPLTWAKVPAHTAEIDLFVAGLNGNGSKLDVAWGVTGLKPSLRSFTGKLPAGAIVGRNSLGTLGYSVCPPKGSEEEYIAIVDALKKAEPMKPGFSAASLLEHLLHTEVSEGRVSFTYKRR
jgi:phosphatidylethanolamine-binding protein (PEBP) family uncharacterized protein